MSDTELQFRTSTFGGFQKQDVLNYIETSNQEHREKLEAVRRELAEAEAAKAAQAEETAAAQAQTEAKEKELQALREELAAAHKEAEERKLEISLLEEELEKAKQRLADTEAQLKESEEKLAKAGPAAAAYEKVKDRTAGIELEAHCRATAEAAMEIVCALAAAGVCLDETPVYAAALLHDVSKGTPDHALAGAGLMSQLGYPVLAPLIAQHHDIEDPARVNEALVVYMADKLCRGDRRVSVSGRFRASFDKCRDAEALAAHDRRYKAALTAAHTINDICGKEVIPI